VLPFFVRLLVRPPSPAISTHNNLLRIPDKPHYPLDGAGERD